jgi:hypothetical protein
MTKLNFVFVVLFFTLTTSVHAAPLGLLFTSASEPVSASNVKSYTKKVSGSVTGLFYILSLGDASIETMARKAGITEIKHIDKHTFSILLGFYTSQTYTIYGN